MQVSISCLNSMLVGAGLGPGVEEGSGPGAIRLTAFQWWTGSGAGFET